MATEVNTWCDPYPVVTWIDGKGRQDSEKPVYATQVIDGKGYRISMPPDGKEGLMKTYCIGPVKVIDGKAVIIEKLEKQVTDPSPASISQAQEVEEEAVKKLGVRETTTGRPVTLVPEDFLNTCLKDGLSSRKASDRYKQETGIEVSYVTFSKLLKGQGLLV